MNRENNEIMELVDHAVNGDKTSLEMLAAGVQDMVFNLALRMLGTVPDAEDATQEILIRVISNLSSFRKKSAFQTWVYRLAVNYLLDYKKSMFAKYPLDFEFYGNDIRYAKTDEIEDLVDELSREAFAEELKMSCTNVMLQCLDAQSRCIFILGTMFRIDSRTGSEILNMTPENYRQKLSRARQKMADFLAEYCGLTGTGNCSCNRRVDYAIAQRRINPAKLEFGSLKELDGQLIGECKEEMEKLDELAMTFERFPHYRSPVSARKLIENILNSSPFRKIQQY